MERNVTDLEVERELNVAALSLWLDEDCEGRSADALHCPAPTFASASVRYMKFKVLKDFSVEVLN